MTDDLNPAEPGSVKAVLSHALRFDGKRRLHHGDVFMAELMARHLFEALEASGYVLMKRPALQMPTTGHFMRGERQAGP